MLHLASSSDTTTATTTSAFEYPTFDSVKASAAAATETVETFELADRPSANTLLLKAPIARGFAFLVGGGLTTLGALGLFTSLHGGNAIFGLFHVDLVSSALYLATGMAGGAAFTLARGRLATAYTIAMMFVYITFFSVNNIAYGNADGGSVLTVLGTIHIHDLPQFMANGMQVTLAMVALLTAGAIALQQGARATARNGRRVLREYRSHTQLPVSAKVAR